MANHSSQLAPSPLAVAEAVETLSQLAELEVDKTSIAKPNQLQFCGFSTHYYSIHMLDGKGKEKGFAAANETFQRAFSFLKKTYSQSYLQSQRGQEKFARQMMILAGEASKKLSRLTQLFTHAHQPSPFKKLSFTARQKPTDEKSTSFNALISQSLPASDEQKGKLNHVFIGLDGVIKDSEYELVLLRKPDGSRFYHPRILRNLRLIANLKEENAPSPYPLFSYKEEFCQQSANYILKKIMGKLEAFYAALPLYREIEVIAPLQKMAYALMLAANSHPAHLADERTLKKTSRYFFDFATFLRQALLSKEYPRWLNATERDPLATAAIDLAHSTLEAFFKSSPNWTTIEQHLKPLLSHQPRSSLSTLLIQDEQSLQKSLKSHPFGPIYKTITALLQQESSFDPIYQQSFPTKQFDLLLKNQRVPLFNIPSPTEQSTLDQAKITPEFKGWLSQNSAKGGQALHLMFNYQDRTSWKEYARCSALEELAKLEKQLLVITLAKEGDFYLQQHAYADLNQASLFLKVFKEQLLSDGAEFYFSTSIKHYLRSLISPLFKAIHEIFFASRNALPRLSRLEFIDLSYFFLELALIDHLKPNSIIHTCKDGSDTSPIMSAKLYTFLKYLQGERLSPQETLSMRAHLFAPALLQRERILFFAPFNRFVNSLKVMEEVIEERGHKEFKRQVQSKILPLIDLNSLKIES